MITVIWPSGVTEKFDDEQQALKNFIYLYPNGDYKTLLQSKVWKITLCFDKCEKNPEAIMITTKEINPDSESIWNEP